MNQEQWQKINELLDAVLALAPAEREAYLEAHCPNADICREVRSLLQAHEQSETFLEEPEGAFDLLPTLPEADSLIGHELDGFKILRVVGRGGMGIVYEAEDLELGRRVALKIIDPMLARDATFGRRFQGEGRSLALIDSPHIVRVYALRRAEAGVFIVMEFVEGGTIKDLIDQKPLSWERAAPLIDQTLIALGHAHSVGVIHRDIKPSNILLTRAGTVKVTDFGLAKVYEQDQSLTVTQGIAGTLHYMSPEQVLARRDLDPRTDLYSMGVMIYQMFAGRLPYDADASEYKTMRAIVEGERVLLAQLRPDLPAHVLAAVEKAMAIDPADRFQSADEMRAAFKATLSDGPPPDDGDERSPWRRRVVYAGGGVLAVGLLVWAAIALWPITRGPSPPLLRLTSAPGDARVLINGTERGRTDPGGSYTDFELTNGSFRVVVQKDEHEAWTYDGEAAEGDTLALTAVLQPAGSGRLPLPLLRLSSTPGDARVQINGADRGRTDASGQFSSVEVPEGALRVVVSKDGHESWSATRQVALGDTLALTAALRRSTTTPPENDTQPPRTVALTLDARPAGTTVQVRGAPGCRVGATCRIDAGATYTATFSHPQYGSRQARIRATGDRALTYYLAQEVTVDARTDEDETISTSIWVDGTTQNTWFTLKTLTLGPGTHEITVRKDGFTVLDAPKTVRVEPGFERKNQVVTFQVRRQ